ETTEAVPQRDALHGIVQGIAGAARKRPNGREQDCVCARVRTHLRSQTKKIGGDQSVNLVHRYAKAKRMPLPGPGAVVTALEVGLLRLLRRLRIRTAGKSRTTCEIQAEPRGRIENIGPRHCVLDVVGIAVVGKTVEQPRLRGEFVIQAGRPFGLVEGSLITSIKNIEGCIEDGRGVEVLPEIFS